MSTASMTPGSRPRTGVIAVTAVAVTLAAVGLALAVGEATSPPRVAGAAELVPFASCDEMAAWGREAMQAQEVGRGGEALVAADVATEAAPTAAGASAEDAAGGTDGTAAAGAGIQEAGPGDATNVAVEGVDELDLVDHLGDDRVLVASASRLAVVDLAAAEVVTSRPVPDDAQVTYDAEAGVAWVVGHDAARGNVTVDRVTVGDDALTTDGTWATTGYLVDARRVGGELHLVAAEGFGAPWVAEDGVERLPTEAGSASAGTADDSTLPFAGGPVPCDQVLRPVGPTEPQATLIVTLPATGAVEPLRAAEVVGSGEQVHVTLDAAYLATPEYTGDEVTTGIHRFDLATLERTGSGRVEGRLLNQFSLSEARGHLRVAVTTGGDVMGMPVVVDVAPPGDDIARPRPVPSPASGEARNEVVVLDTTGDLDVVGRTARFGKPGESIHGIRFAGDTAYAVTFLTTDPFYVIDLSTPSAPRVLGQVELPGFSAYLHPLSGDLVVGFGPGEDGRATATLFDVSDPGAPRVADSLLLGDESAVTWDHHAFVDLGEGRFAVPASTWRATFPQRCGPAEQAAAQAEIDSIEAAMNAIWSEPDPDEAAADDLARQYDAVISEGCAYPGSATDSAAVVVDASGGRLAEEARQTVTTGQPATRLVSGGEGWALLAGDQIVVLDPDGQVRATLRLA